MAQQDGALLHVMHHIESGTLLYALVYGYVEYLSGTPLRGWLCHLVGYEYVVVLTSSTTASTLLASEHADGLHGYLPYSLCITYASW